MLLSKGENFLCQVLPTSGLLNTRFRIFEKNAGMRAIKILGIITFCYLIAACESKNNESASEVVTRKATIEDVERGIRNNIEEITKEGGGYFNIKNDSVDLSLKLVRVHTEYLSVLGKNEFFACVDLATVEGDVYDVDFFMKGDAENMTVTQTDVHKLNGKPYYTWKQAKDKTWFTVPVKNASNDLLGVIEEKDQFSFEYKAILPEISENARMWLPIATSDDYQEVSLVFQSIPGEYAYSTDPDYGNKILIIDLTSEQSQDTILLTYNVLRKEKSAYEGDNNEAQRHLQAAALLPVGDRFATIADEVIKEREATTPLMKARALYDYVIDNVRYAKQGVYGTGDANYACDSKSGNCTEFHSLFISLARSAGIPARFAVGAAIPSSRDDGGVDGYHCWAEFYAEGKWWPVDISEADKYSALSTYYFGHHPANRIEFSKGRDLKPDPIPSSGPINFLAYPVLEVEGEPDFAKVTFTFSRNRSGI